jgi:hypothetical protein
MGGRDKLEDMKHRRTNLEAVAPEADKPETDKPENRTSMDTMDRSPTPHRTEARLGREVQARIGQQLRAMYDDVVNQGVPQHIDDLIRRLSEQD